ncbi:MAG: TIGR00730 family Rossman fold protein [Bacteroidales bacterium]|mgnify:CR=1 FL=1|nr:TIGR00730 family Rossman fold protein [Bacteroidales bacterium]
MKSIGLFCGSHTGNNPLFAQHAAELGKLIAAKKLTLVYGGSSWGLMGITATEVMNANGNIVGIIPDFFSDNVVEHRSITLHKVKSMAERKEMMASMADAFVALPGGIGTLDEVTEIMSMNQLGLIAKPIGLLNIDGFFDPFLKQITLMQNENLIHEVHSKMLVQAPDSKTLLDKLKNLELPNQDEWFKVIKK